jgi:hypothetical protein
MEELTNEIILSVCSPKDEVEGPFVVVYNGGNWAIVAFTFQDTPSLGIRWFHCGSGMPVGRNGAPVWFRIPEELNTSILNGLPLSSVRRHNIDDYLCGNIRGEELWKSVKHEKVF